jgi:hypothetical protein
MANEFNPTLWLTTLIDAVENYVKTEIAQYVLNGAGLQVYEIIMDDPASNDSPIMVPLEKTIIHFAVDDVDNTRVGFGPQYIDEVETEGTVDAAGTVIPYEAVERVVAFDVGVWATDSTGGASALYAAYEALSSLFSGDVARERMNDVTGGVEIRTFTNGRFVKESINDVRVHRIVGADLTLRVYSKKQAETEIIVDMESVQAQELVVDASTPLN